MDDRSLEHRGIQSDIQILVRDGVPHSLATSIARRALGKTPRIYNKKDKMSKWIMCIYKDGKLVNTYYYYNLTELRNAIPELNIFLNLKTFDETVIKYDRFIELKYGALRIRKLRGKNSMKYYFQMNNIY
jgi:hypothetical protein